MSDTVGNVYGIMSFWGHMMTLEKKSQRARFRPLLSLPPSALHTCRSFSTEKETLSGLSIGNHATVWTICKGSLPGCVSFLHEGKYVGSDINGELFFAEKQSTWENFFLISLEDTDLLKSILLSRFRLQENDAGNNPRIGLEHFNLIWNGKKFPLHLNIPIAERYQEGRLQLDAPEMRIKLQYTPFEPQKPIIWLNLQGNIGNRALLYLAAEGIREHAPEAEIRNIRLEMWGIDAPAPRPETDVCASTGSTQFSLDTRGLGDCLHRGEVEAIAIDSYAFCLDHYPSREKCRELLPPITGTESVTGFGKDQLVCNIRTNEILRGAHPDYIPLPVRYYQLLEEESGKEIVFYGQLGDDPYSENLRRHFSHAQFVESRGPKVDFETIRKSKNIAIAISTFSWLAAWLSNADRIYMPMGGMFNPVQHPEQTYLPVDDPAFRFILLPYAKTVNIYEHSQEFWQIQEKISQFVRFASLDEVREAVTRMTTWPITKRIMVGPFDSKYYCSQYPDAASNMLALKMTALEYYLKAGYRHSHIVDFDESFYGKTYPDATADVALGRSPNLLHHFICKGWQLGYNPRQ